AEPSGERVEHGREVVAGAAGEVEHQARPAGVEPRGQFGDRVGDWLVVPAAEEAHPRHDHRGTVAGPRAALPADQADVALPRDVEAVPAVAGHLVRTDAHRPGADGAADVRGDGRERPPLVKDSGAARPATHDAKTIRRRGPTTRSG